MSEDRVAQTPLLPLPIPTEAISFQTPVAGRGCELSRPPSARLGEVEKQTRVLSEQCLCGRHLKPPKSDWSTESTVDGSVDRLWRANKLEKRLRQKRKETR